MAAAQDSELLIEARHAHIHAQLAEVDKATANLITAIENGTDPSLINPRLNQLRIEREMLAGQIRYEPTFQRLTPADIDTLMAELGGLPQVFEDATPPEKTAIYQALGLRLVDQPDDNAVVATADLGRVVSRVGGGTYRPLVGRTPCPTNVEHGRSLFMCSREYVTGGRPAARQGWRCVRRRERYASSAGVSRSES